MGKGILIFVIATSLSVTAMYVAGEEAEVASLQTEADYKSELLARETAQSAYNMVVSKVKRDFEGYRASYTDLDYGKATYDMRAEDGDDGTVTVVAVGKYGDHEYEITGSISNTTSTVLDAVTITAPITGVDLQNDFVITGHDLAGSGSNDSAHGVKVTQTATYDAFMASSNVGQIIGAEGVSDVVNETTAIDIGRLRAQINNYSGSNRTNLSDATSNLGTSDSIGGSSTPEVVIVTGDVILTNDFVGYGVLFVEGNFTMTDNATWYGVVYVAGSTSAFEMRDYSVISGAVIIDGIDTDVAIPPIDDNDRGLLGGHFDIDVFDEAGSTRERYHQHAYDDKFATTSLDLLSSGCKNGGMCWSNFVASRNLTEVQVETFNTGAVSGTYTIDAGSNSWAGNAASALSLTLDPRDLTTFRFNFASLCTMVPTSPSRVQEDATSRQGAFTVRVSTTGGEVIYEMAVYHHPKGGNTCSSAGDETVWMTANGSTYSGSNSVCSTEDGNDRYSDAWQRENFWGKRHKDKSSKKSSKKSKKKSGKGNRSQSIYWTPSGTATCHDGVSNAPQYQFTLINDSAVIYNAAVLSGLKAMFADLEMRNGGTVARRVGGKATKRDAKHNMDGTTTVTTTNSIQ